MKYTIIKDKITSDILNYQVSKLECKHVINNQPLEIFNESVKVNYEYIILGSHRHSSISEEIKRIHDMANNKSFNRPVRIVRTVDGRLWCDNTHTAIAYLWREYSKMETLMIKNIPFYVVDLSKDNPIIISYNDSVLENEEDITNIINCSREVNNRVIQGVRPSNLNYTINDLSKNLLLFTAIRIKQLYQEEINKPSQLLSEMNISGYHMGKS